MDEDSRWQPPTRPTDWLPAAEAILGHFFDCLSRYGIAPSPELALVNSESALPYYENETQSIGLGMPDPATLAGRLYWLFVSRLAGTDGVETAVQSVAMQLPFLVAHEAVHHLRHKYAAPTENDFIEEQVANTVALAYVQEFDRYRDVASHLATVSAAADQSLDAAAGGAQSYVSGFRLDLGDVLLENANISQGDLDRVARFAAAINRPLDEVLDQTLFADPAVRVQAQQLQQDAEHYFNDNYLSSFIGYARFFAGWLHWYTNSARRQTLGDLLVQHILSSDWARTREHETAWFVHSLLGHPVDALAAAAAEFLAGNIAPDPADVELMVSSQRSAVRIAALRTMPVSACADPRVMAGVAHCQASTDPDEAGAAAALLLAARGRDAASEASGSAADALTKAIESPGNARLDGLRALGSRGVSVAVNAALCDAVIDSLGSDRAAERSAAARALALAEPNEVLLSHLTPMLTDVDAVVRRDVVRAYVRHQPNRHEAARVLLRSIADPSDGVRAEAQARLAGMLADLRDALNETVLGQFDWDARIRLCRLTAHDNSRHAGVLAREILGELSFWRCKLLLVARSLPEQRSRSGELLQLVIDEEIIRLQVLAVSVAQAVEPSAALGLVLRGLTNRDPDTRKTAIGMARELPLTSDLRAALDTLFDLPSEVGQHSGPATSVADVASHYPEAFLRTLVNEWLRPRPSERPDMLTATEKLVFLHSARIFSASPIRDLGELAEFAVVRSYRAGERIVAAGAKPEAMYLVASGSVRIHGRDVTRNQLVGPRESFGELELLSGRSYEFTADAAENATVICVPGDRFFGYATADPGVLVRWTQILSSQLLDEMTSGNKAIGRTDPVPARERGLSYIWQIPPDLASPDAGPATDS